MQIFIETRENSGTLSVGRVYKSAFTCEMYKNLKESGKVFIQSVIKRWKTQTFGILYLI